MFSVVNDLRTKSLELSRLQRRTFFLWNFFKEGAGTYILFFVDVDNINQLILGILVVD